MEREVGILAGLAHPNILQVYGIACPQDDWADPNAEIFMIM